MAVRIRLHRMGAKKKPYYRIVVADARSPRDGKYIEEVGLYHPVGQPERIEIDRERVLEWMARGAQPSDTVKSLFKRTGIAADSAKE